ncbi:single-stranded DNA-binding protein [Candidatus Daviesbacteria bacterium]|nr:single-stranded DNA-binding protein [Candidatus Daviesbacteria bacterium]
MASRSWNRVELIGNLTRDPELRYTPQGTAVVTFSIATNRTFVSDGEKKEETDFHRIVAWNKLAELCSQLLKKGNRVFVSGRLQNRSWEGQDGQTRNVTEIVIEDMILLTSRNGVVSEEYAAARAAKAAEPVEDVSPKVEEEPAADVSSEEKAEKKPAKAATEDPGDLDDLPF